VKEAFEIFLYHTAWFHGGAGASIEGRGGSSSGCLVLGSLTVSSLSCTMYQLGQNVS
jgi:hypothetical protein